MQYIPNTGSIFQCSPPRRSFAFTPSQVLHRFFPPTSCTSHITYVANLLCLTTISFLSFSSVLYCWTVPGNTASHLYSDRIISSHELQHILVTPLPRLHTLSLTATLTITYLIAIASQTHHLCSRRLRLQPLPTLLCLRQRWA